MGELSYDWLSKTSAGNFYPAEPLVGCETALVLFAAAFFGRQDAIHLADAGLRGTCVDLDAEKLAEMELHYPIGWQFVTADAFAFAEGAPGRRWDVVSLDPPTSLFDRCAEEIGLWCALSARAVILGTGTDTMVRPPHGWELTDRINRSMFAGGVYWTVLERL